VACSLLKETKKQKQNDPSLSLKKVYISPTWGDAPLEPIATKFDSSLYLTEVINHSKFGVDWFCSFGSGEVQNLMFAIGTTRLRRWSSVVSMTLLRRTCHHRYIVSQTWPLDVGLGHRLTQISF